MGKRKICQWLPAVLLFTRVESTWKKILWANHWVPPVSSAATKDCVKSILESLCFWTDKFFIESSVQPCHYSWCDYDIQYKNVMILTLIKNGWAPKMFWKQGTSYESRNENRSPESNQTGPYLLHYLEKIYPFNSVKKLRNSFISEIHIGKFIDSFDAN